MNVRLVLRNRLLESASDGYETWLKSKVGRPLEMSHVIGGLIKDVDPNMMTADFTRYNSLIKNSEPPTC